MNKISHVIINKYINKIVIGIAIIIGTIGLLPAHTIINPTNTIDSNATGSIIPITIPVTLPITLPITIPLTINADDQIYKESIALSCDHPHITISSWHVSGPESRYYDQVTDTTKDMYGAPASVTFMAQIDHNYLETSDKIIDAHAHISYQKRADGLFHTALVPLIFDTTSQTSHISQTSQINLSDSLTSTHISPTDTNNINPTLLTSQTSPTSHTITVTINTPETSTNALATSEQTANAPDSDTQNISWKEYISGFLTKSQSIWVQLLFSLLLGVLLSLTPCIYPMIPITAGIIQAQGGSSLGHNFLLSLSYTLGLSTTFAFLGLAAAFAGQLVGSLFTNPIFVFSIVIMLCYLAFSMLGFYELTMPRIIGFGSQNTRGGSFLSCFALGALSGTVSSPCVSPGLLMLLTIVTTLGSKLLGFLLLLFFGFGLSIPLLVIGTFSGSLNMLPRAGAWMVEIKKMFGFMMLGMCFYFLAFMLSTHALLLGLAGLALGCGLFYLNDARKPYSCWVGFKNAIGMGSIAGSVVLASFAFSEFYRRPLSVGEEETIWHMDYDTGRAHAQASGKKILLDFGAPYCASCRVIEQKLFKHPEVLALFSDIVPIKIDVSADHPVHAELLKKMKIIGTPTCLLIDPTNEQELCRWGDELCSCKPEVFIEKVRIHCDCTNTPAT